MSSAAPTEEPAPLVNPSHYEAILQAIVEAIGLAGVGLCVISPQKRIEYMNDVARARFGDKVGTACHKTLAGKDDACGDCRLERVLAAESPEQSLMTLHDGSIVEVIGVPLKLPGGGVSKLSILRDVTPVARAQAALQKSEQRLQNLIDSSLQGILVHRNDKALFVNPAYARMHGYENPEDILALPTIWELFAPEERSRLRGYRDQRLIGHAAPHQYEYQGIHKDGSRIWLLNMAATVDWDGKPAIQSVVIDVSAARKAQDELRAVKDRLEVNVEERTQALQRKMEELKYAEKELRNQQATIQALLDNSTAIISARDIEGRYLLVNPAWERITHIPAADAIGRSSEAVHPPDISERMRKLDREVLEQDIPIEREEEIIVGDQPRTFIATRFPIHDSLGRIQAVCLIATDITERKRNEIEIDRARQLAEAADRAKSEFLANMSHELRTPLNAVIGFSEMIRGRILGPLSDGRYDEYVDHILTSGRHLLDLINDVLDLSKVAAGRIALEETAVDPARICAEAVDMVAERAKHQGVALSCHIPSEAPRLYADSRRLRQIVLNLLSNAVKFTGHGGRASLTLNCDSQGLEIVVEDSGIGIAADDIPRVLEPFGRLESALHRQYEGTGLGLPLTKKLVEAQQGALTIISAPGAGTRVTVRFPHERILDKTVPISPSAPPQDAA